jgi:hypothetical protein
MYFRDGKLVLRGNGDNYTGNVQGRDRVGDLKFLPGDPKLGQPWMLPEQAVVLFTISVLDLDPMKLMR